MEAPEKIYLVNDDLNIKREWYLTKQVGFETTEYTRTYAFIEKACEYLEPILTEYAGFYVGGDILQHFRKVMKE